MMKASYKVRQWGWKVDKVETTPVAIAQDSFDTMDLSWIASINVKRTECPWPVRGIPKRRNYTRTLLNLLPVECHIDLHDWLSDQKRTKNTGEWLSDDAPSQIPFPHSIAMIDFPNRVYKRERK
ncbi:MAG: hypothetical protein P1U58_14335 [Verrucomicrobiales bacterium]|nr:hypothetical protein [Verrucomicrobiales bacterium]